MARLANLTMPKIDPKIFEPLFANLTMPSIDPKIFEPLFANLTMPSIDPKIFEPLFANLTMPSIEPKIFEPLFANLNLSTVVAGLPVLASEWIEQGPEGVRLQDYVMAATIAVAPATDLAPLESSEKASRVMGTAIVIMALWAVFMRTPELRPVLEFLAFPLTIGSYIWAALNKD